MANTTATFFIFTSMLLIFCLFWVEVKSWTVLDMIKPLQAQRCDGVYQGDEDEILNLSSSIEDVIKGFLDNNPPCDDMDHVISSTNLPIVEGHALCAINMTPSDCQTCMLAAARSLRKCIPAVGGTAKLRSCSMWYSS